MTSGARSTHLESSSVDFTLTTTKTGALMSSTISTVPTLKVTLTTTHTLTYTVTVSPNVRDPGP